MACTKETMEDFKKKLSDMRTIGSTALGVAMGIETGLLATMTTFDEPKTCQQIADKSGLKERYVRELLSVMVCGGIVDLDATSHTFYLPDHRRRFFTRGCPEEESAMGIRCLPMLASSFDKVKECFKLDGPRGFPDAHFNYDPEMSRVRFQDHLIEQLRTFPGLQDQLEAGIHVLDVACGAGLSTILMAKQFPKSHFTGLDIASEVIDEAKRSATNHNLSNLEFVCASGTDMPPEWSGKFDFLFVYNGVHDAFRPDKFLQESLRVLKPGAKAMILEPSSRSNLADNVQTPSAAGRYAYSLFRCLPTSLDAEGSLGLGAAWGKEKCQEMLEETGFTIQSAELEIGGSTWAFMCTKPAE